MTHIAVGSPIDLLGISFIGLTSQQLLVEIEATIKSNQKALILSGNVHSFNLAYENQWLRDFFNQADIVRLDGAGLRLGAKLVGINTPPRMTWADFVWDLAELCAHQQFTLYFLGARPGIAEQAAGRLKEQFPDLQIVGTVDGYFTKNPGHPENEAVITAINQIRPHILIVGLGMPLQEKWLRENRERLDVNVILTGGAVFDYVSGELQRGPTWMTNNGLEWLARLLIEPRRLWRRYIVGNPLFLWRALKQRLGFRPMNSPSNFSGK